MDEDFSVEKKYCPVMQQNIVVKTDYNNSGERRCLCGELCKNECKNKYL